MTPPVVAVRVLVCGNADRGDDGAPLATIARLLPSLPSAILERIEVRRCVQLDATDLIDVADGEACLIVDTVVGVAPGDIVTLPLDCLAAAPGPVSPRSSHALPIDQTIALAAAIRGAPVRGSFVGIGGRWFAYGQRRFSRPVKTGMAAFREAIIADLETLLDGSPATVAENPVNSDAMTPAGDRN